MSHGPDDIFVDPSAILEDHVVVGSGTKVWGLTHVRRGAKIGLDCVLGRGAYIGPGVVIGDNSKIQNGALLYEPAALAAGVFIGPGAILTNDTFPRAVKPDGHPKGTSDWVAVGVHIAQGASIGAGAICVAPLQIGEWAMVAAGAVVTADVKPHSMVRGVPARHVGWVSRAGYPLEKAGHYYLCPTTGERYREDGGFLTVVPGDSS